MSGIVNGASATAGAAAAGSAGPAAAGSGGATGGAAAAAPAGAAPATGAAAAGGGGGTAPASAPAPSASKSPANCSPPCSAPGGASLRAAGAVTASGPACEAGARRIVALNAWRSTRVSVRGAPAAGRSKRAMLALPAPRCSRLTASRRSARVGPSERAERRRRSDGSGSYVAAGRRDRGLRGLLLLDVSARIGHLDGRPYSARAGRQLAARPRGEVAQGGRLAPGFARRLDGFDPAAPRRGSRPRASRCASGRGAAWPTRRRTGGSAVDSSATTRTAATNRTTSSPASSTSPTIAMSATSVLNVAVTIDVQTSVVSSGGSSRRCARSTSDACEPHSAIRPQTPKARQRASTSSPAQVAPSSSAKPSPAAAVVTMPTAARQPPARWRSASPARPQRRERAEPEAREDHAPRRVAEVAEEQGHDRRRRVRRGPRSAHGRRAFAASSRPDTRDPSSRRASSRNARAAVALVGATDEDDAALHARVRDVERGRRRWRPRGPSGAAARPRRPRRRASPSPRGRSSRRRSRGRSPPRSTSPPARRAGGSRA